jgi:dihydrofolate synthase/folylpolyglutamate synthase
MFAQLPMYQEKGKIAFNAKLETIKKFAGHLDNPHKKFKSIHVGGTNGKGSSSHMLASILQEAGYKVGLYTSPHLKDFRERIKINGSQLSEDFVIDFIQDNSSFLEKHQLSFFEMTVGMAFAYFAQKKVDIAIIEVGLGGRFDSTNIIVPEVSLITNIGFDHTDMLGNTLKKIASEKAGIIKKEVPIVVSEYQAEIAEVFQNTAETQDSTLVYGDKLESLDYKSDLLGQCQAKNIKGVVAVLKELKGFKVKETHIKAGLKNVVDNTGLMGRWQILGHEPKIVCDTAHNIEGLTLVMEQIRQENYDVLHIVLGFVKDKNLGAILSLFPKNAKYYYCTPTIQRGLAVEILHSSALEFGLRGDVYSSVAKALNAAKKTASRNDFIFVGGSNFVVAEVV